MAKLRQMGGDDQPIQDNDHFVQDNPMGFPGTPGNAPPPPPDNGETEFPGPIPGNPTPPRDEPRPGGAGAPPGPGQATPRQPMEPTPDAGSTSPGPQGPMPFNPLPGPDLASLGSPRRRGLFGGLGGLTEGGLGVPGNGGAQGPDMISSLIQQLLSTSGKF